MGVSLAPGSTDEAQAIAPKAEPIGRPEELGTIPSLRYAHEAGSDVGNRTDARERRYTNMRLIRVKDVAEALAVGRSTAYKLVAQGELPSVRINGAVRVPAEAVKDYVDNQLALTAKER